MVKIALIFPIPLIFIVTKHETKIDDDSTLLPITRKGIISISNSKSEFRSHNYFGLANIKHLDRESQ